MKVDQDISSYGWLSLVSILLSFAWILSVSLTLFMCCCCQKKKKKGLESFLGQSTQRPSNSSDETVKLDTGDSEDTGGKKTSDDTTTDTHDMAVTVNKSDKDEKYRSEKRNEKGRSIEAGDRHDEHRSRPTRVQTHATKHEKADNVPKNEYRILRGVGDKIEASHAARKLDVVGKNEYQTMGGIKNAIEASKAANAPAHGNYLNLSVDKKRKEENAPQLYLELGAVEPNKGKVAVDAYSTMQIAGENALTPSKRATRKHAAAKGSKVGAELYGTMQIAPDKALTPTMIQKKATKLLSKKEATRKPKKHVAAKDEAAYGTMFGVDNKMKASDR